MKKLYMKQALLSLHQKITVHDENGDLAYEVSSAFMSLHDKTRIQNGEGREIASIHKKLLSLHERYIVEMENGDSFQLHSELFHLAKDIIDIDELGWTIRGNLMEHNYQITDQNDRVLADAHRKWISLHEAYQIEIFDTDRTDTLIAVLIVLEHILTTRAQNRTAMNNNAN